MGGGEIAEGAKAAGEVATCPPFAMRAARGFRLMLRAFSEPPP